MHNENSRDVYINVTLSTPQGRKIHCRALVDTGNTVNTKSVITRKLHNQIGMGFSEIGGKAVNTAKTGSGLKKIGVSKEITMTIDGMDHQSFQIKPTVVEDLCDDLNLGNGFLAETGDCDILYRGNLTKLRIGKDKVELVRTIDSNKSTDGCTEPEVLTGKADAETLSQGTAGGAESSNSKDCYVSGEQTASGAESSNSKDCHVSREQAASGAESSNSKDCHVSRKQKVQDKKSRKREPGYCARIKHVYCSQDVKIKKNTMTFVDGYLGGQEDKVVGRKKEILVEPLAGAGRPKTVAAVYRLENRGKIAVLNVTDQDMIIPRDSKLGEYSEIEPIEFKPSNEKVRELREGNPKIDDLIKKLKIEENEILKENPVVKDKLIQIIEEYSDVFSDPEGVEIGTTDLIEFSVELKEGARPVKQKLRPLNPKQRESLRKQLDLWQKEGVIEESNSPWASPLVPAKKKSTDPNAIRWAVDYRSINSMTVSDAWPIPSIEENLEKLQGAKFFSAIDASAAYHTVRVQKKSRPYLAFLTPWGTYQYRKMPFGAKNAGACYSRLVELAIMKLRSPNILAYLDDIICATQDLWQHVKELENVFKLHREAGIKIKAEKTHIIRPEVEYLGYMVSEEGVKMKPSYVEKIVNWPAPKTVKELNTVLGFLGYYRSFIPKFSELTNTMNAQKKEKTLVWTKEMNESFEALKQEFTKMPVRSYPDYQSEEPFELALDFSAKNVAAILSQKQGGKERFIGAAGRKTTKYEKNYHSCKGELAAIIYGLRKFEHILKFKKFIIHTDSKALTYLQTMKKLTGIYFRWLSEIQEYDFEIRHRPGKKNSNCDAMSRCDHLEVPTREEEEEEEGYIHRLYTLVKKLERHSGAIRNLHRNNDRLTKNNLIREQKNDKILGQVRKWVREGKLPSKQEIRDQPEELKVYYQNFPLFKIKKGVLYRVKNLNSTGEIGTKLQICVPEKLKPTTHVWSHSHVSAGHFGIQATLHRMQQKFYYPAMKKDSETRVKACPDCLAKIQRVKVRDATHQPRKTGYVGELLFVDLVGPMPVTRRGEKYILTIEDAYTRYVAAIPIPNKEAATVTKHHMDRYVSIFGTPSAIHSDQGKEFTSQVFTDLMDKLQVRRTTTPAYNPQSNGNLERFHRTLNSIIRVFADREDTEWSQYLPSATLAYNTKRHSSTGITPFAGMFGRECRLPIDLIIPSPDDKSKDINVHVKETLDRFKRMYNHVRNKNQAVIKRNAQLYTGKTNELEVGTNVWYLAPRKVKGKPMKITDQWMGPFKITGKPTPVLVEITPSDYEGPTITTHMARVTPCSSVRGNKQRIPNKINLDDRGDELAEEILAPNTLDQPSELGIPIKFVQDPDYEITDISNRSREPKASASSNQIEPAHADEPGPSPIQDITGARDQGRGTKRSNKDTDSELGEQKEPKRRQRRTRAQLKEENEKKRKREMTQQSTEESEAQPRRPEQPFPFLPSGMSQYLPDTSDSDVIDAIRTLVVDVAAGSSLPARATEGSAAYDVKAHHALVIPPNSTGLVSLNLKVSLPKDHFMLLLSRSGLALKGITVEGGVIDPDYHQEVKAIIRNNTPSPFKIQRGQRIAQAIFLPIVKADFNLVEQLEDVDQDHDGFGSTGM